MTNNVTRYLPGDKVTVEVVADSSDAVVTQGELAEISGENEAYTEVQGIQSQGNESIGLLLSDPRKLSDDGVTASDFTSGDSVGTAEVLLAKPVANANVASGYTPTAGDFVQETTDGVEAFEGAATQATTPLGIVFTTNARDFGQGTGIAVALIR